MLSWFEHEKSFINSGPDQPAHLPNLIRLFTGCILERQGLKIASCGQLKPWWDCKVPSKKRVPREDSGPNVIKLFTCLTQFSINFVLLINLKLLTIAKSFLLNLAEHENFSANKYENANYCWHFSYLLAEKISCSAEEHEKSFITSGPDQPAHLPNLIRIFTGHILESQGLKIPSCGQLKPWWDCNVLSEKHVCLGKIQAPRL